ncbi:glycoside hydrolase family 65 protein [Mariniluteicoccus flavus]
MGTDALDPWVIRESALPGAGPVAASVLTVANGRLGVRGSLDEAEHDPCRGTFLAGVHETHPLSYPEDGFGQPQEGEAMVPVADGTPIRLVVDGVPVDVRAITPTHHERRLDLRAGVLARETTWDVGGRRVTLRTDRLVSAAFPGVLAIRWRLSADADAGVRVTVRSQLVANATPPIVDNDDPRVGDVLASPFEAECLRRDDHGGAFVHRTRRSGIRVGAAVRHVIAGASGGGGTDLGGGGPRVTTEATDDEVVTTVTADLATGEELGLVKFAAYATTADGEADEVLEHARAAVADAADLGWDALAERQRDDLDTLWDRAGVVIEGDDELEQAVRFSIFQVWQASARIEDAPIGAKGLTGGGYSGHTFWDIEGFVLPVLSYLDPDAARRLLCWRSSTLPAAKRRAEQLQVDGAVFAWRTISGREVSGYWPASTAAMHNAADIARAYELYGAVTGHDPREVGSLDVLVETARLWASLGRSDADGRWHLFGMTGPDEYTGVVDDNVFTNLMAARNLRAAADAVDADPDGARRHHVGGEETEAWRAAAAAAYVPVDDDRGVHPACAGFTDFAEWDFEGRRDDYPVQEHAHYFTIYRHQVVKQADLVQALWWCEDSFSPDEIARDFAYYEARTVRDSSLSAAVQAVVAARIGHLDLAYAYWREAALVDLRDLQGNTDEGLHVASLGGTWLAMVNGFGGVRERGGAEGRLRLEPRLPPKLTRLGFRLAWRDHLLDVSMDRAAGPAGDGEAGVVTLRLPHEADGTLEVEVDGAVVTLVPGEPTVVPLRAPEPLLPTPTQPAGREPRA